MDYSAISQADHPSGSSPWDSPSAERTAFVASSNNDIPPAPLPPQGHSTDDADHPPESPRPQQPRDSSSPDLSERLQSAQLGDSDYAVEQSPYATEQAQHRSHLPARYQAAARQHSKPAPAYRIQAKITALERTGKKDPVLRFDVHVSEPTWPGRIEALTMLDKYSKIPYHPVSRRTAYPFRVR